MPSLSDWLTISQLLSSMAKGRNDAQTQNEALGITAAGSANNDQLNRDKFELAAPGERLGQSLQASRIKGFQPVTPDFSQSAYGHPVVHWGGGVGAPDPQTKQLSDEIMHQHLVDQLSGKDRRPLTPQPQIGQTDATSKILSGAQTGATGLSILKLLGLLGGGGGRPGSTPVTGGRWEGDTWVADGGGGGTGDEGPGRGAGGGPGGHWESGRWIVDY